MTDAQLNVDPAELISAAGRLDALAGRLERTLGSVAPELTVPAAGRDEVSQTSATTFTAVAEAFTTDSAGGVEELRKIADALSSRKRGLAGMSLGLDPAGR